MDTLYPTVADTSAPLSLDTVYSVNTARSALLAAKETGQKACQNRACRAWSALCRAATQGERPFDPRCACAQAGRGAPCAVCAACTDFCASRTGRRKERTAHRTAQRADSAQNGAKSGRCRHVVVRGAFAVGTGGPVINGCFCARGFCKAHNSRLLLHVVLVGVKFGMTRQGKDGSFARCGVDTLPTRA